MDIQDIVRQHNALRIVISFEWIIMHNYALNLIIINIVINIIII